MSHLRYRPGRIVKILEESEPEDGEERVFFCQLSNSLIRQFSIEELFQTSIGRKQLLDWENRNQRDVTVTRILGKRKGDVRNPGGYYVMCSNGFRKWVPASVLGSFSPPGAPKGPQCKELMQAVLKYSRSYGDYSLTWVLVRKKSCAASSPTWMPSHDVAFSPSLNDLESWSPQLDSCVPPPPNLIEVPSTSNLSIEQAAIQTFKHYFLPGFQAVLRDSDWVTTECATSTTAPRVSGRGAMWCPPVAIGIMIPNSAKYEMKRTATGSDIYCFKSASHVPKELVGQRFPEGTPVVSKICPPNNDKHEWWFNVTTEPNVKHRFPVSNFTEEALSKMNPETVCFEGDRLVVAVEKLVVVTGEVSVIYNKEKQRICMSFSYSVCRRNAAHKIWLTYLGEKVARRDVTAEDGTVRLY